jgi:hypothetical protein
MGDLSPFFESRLYYDLQVGIAQEFFCRIEPRVELPFRAGQWFRNIPFFGGIHNAACPPTSAHPFHVARETRHCLFASRLQSPISINLDKKPVAWDQEFFDPIELPDGRKLVKMHDAAKYIQKLRKAEQQLEGGKLRSKLVIENNGPTIWRASASCAP